MRWTKRILMVAALMAIPALGLWNVNANAGGLTCQRQIDVCVNQLDALSDALRRIEAAGNDSAIAKAQERLVRTSISCGNKINDACN